MNVISATPGFWLVRLDGDRYTATQPIIGWRIEPCRPPQPVTPLGYWIDATDTEAFGWYHDGLISFGDFTWRAIRTIDGEVVKYGTLDYARAMQRVQPDGTDDPLASSPPTR